MSLALDLDVRQRSGSIAIVGAGFSGTALAVRLLREPPPWPCRIVLIERTGIFGRGLAYSDRFVDATLNVPATRMSLDERRPDDFREYVRSRVSRPWPDEFMPRAVYGDYLEHSLREAARGAATRVQLVRMNGTAESVSDPRQDGRRHVTLAGGQSMLADAVVLAVGHFAPRPLDALQALGASGLYVNDPWTQDISSRKFDRVLLVGTGLTMADVACKLAAGEHRPDQIVAVSRRGLVSRARLHTLPVGPAVALDCDDLNTARTLREMVAIVRKIMTQAGAHGADWRDVMLALRERVPDLWQRLDDADRKRFVRHVQPYWDVHRHQLPPQVGRKVQSLATTNRLCFRAARIASARVVHGRAVVDLRARGSSRIEPDTFDLIINCSGPDADPRRVDSRLIRSMLAKGQLAADESGLGVRADSQGRLVGRSGLGQSGLYYLGPWLRARDFEATAVHELRRHATALARLLRTGADLSAARIN
jgi:uncharacterized NAD(P)/FAD-binding protein YdhS